MPLGLVFENRGNVDQPAVGLTVWSEQALSPDFVAGLAEEIIYRCSFDLDLGDFNRRFASHPQLGPAIARLRGMRPLNVSSLYEYLIIAIVLQNATVRRSVQMMQALQERYGLLLAYEGKELACFWAPEQVAGVSEDELRGLKVGYRAKSIRRVTEAFVERRDR